MGNLKTYPYEKSIEPIYGHQKRMYIKKGASFHKDLPVEKVFTL